MVETCGICDRLDIKELSLFLGCMVEIHSFSKNFKRLTKLRPGQFVPLTPILLQLYDEGEVHFFPILRRNPLKLKKFYSLSDFRYLLSQHIDLFGWIESGQAIPQN